MQGGGSLNFGKLVWLEGARLHVQVDCSLKPMDPVVLKVDLQPVPGNAMLHGTVMRALPTAQGEPTAYLVRLDSVASDDQVRWHQFLKVKRSGGTLSDLSDVHDGSGAMKATYSSVAERERRAALERMGGGVKHPSGVGGGATPSSAATWSSSSLSEGGGRAAMRDALKAAAKAVLDQDVRVVIYDTLDAMAASDGKTEEEERPLAWLASWWDLAKK